MLQKGIRSVDQNSIVYRQRNALAWKVVSELCRRDNNLYLGPKGGDDNGVDANALMVLSSAGLTYQARRYGLGFVAAKGDMELQIKWDRAQQFNSAREIALALEQGIGFSFPAQSPPTTPRALGYRVIASLLEITATERARWIERSSGGGPLDPDSEFNRGRLKNWEGARHQIIKDNLCIAEFDNFGWVKTERGLVDLQASYKMLDRSLHRVVLEHFGGHLL